MIDGDDLKAMRLNAGITQQGMSKKLECDRRTIHNYELGVSDIPSSRLFQWLKFCKLDISVLLNQIKAVRGEASKNATSKLFDAISVLLVFGTLWDHSVIAPLYLFLLSLFITCAWYTKNINLAHISGFIFALTAINFTIFSTGIIDVVALQENQLLRGTIILGIQLIFSVITMIILIFRVQLSRKLSSSNNIKLTPFDGIFYWLYIFTSIIYALGLLENVAWSYFKIASMDLIYSNIAGLIYISWALCCYMFLTMVVLSINKPRL